MTLHCAGRLGVLSWIYEQRHEIAFELGLDNEKSIAECGSGYLDDGLVIVQQDDDSNARPSVVFTAKEIKLFFDFNVINIDRDFFVIEQSYPVNHVDHYPPPHKSIFHPPAVA